jgi:hypothetical protein
VVRCGGHDMGMTDTRVVDTGRAEKWDGLGKYAQRDGDFFPLPHEGQHAPNNKILHSRLYLFESSSIWRSIRSERAFPSTCWLFDAQFPISADMLMMDDPRARG